jgi:hypothetical protein
MFPLTFFDLAIPAPDRGRLLSGILHQQTNDVSEPPLFAPSTA